jgi:MFS family permease
MISDSQLLYLLLSFAVGSLWVTIVTVVAERYGSNRGGFIGGLPSTSIVALFFIGLNQSVKTAVAATTFVPLALSFSCSFLLSYAVLARRGFSFGILASLLLWFVLAAIPILSNSDNFVLNVVCSYSICFVACFLLLKKVKLMEFPGEKLHYSTFELLSRATFSGFVILGAVLLSQIGGAAVGGIFSAFPAVFSSTLYVTNKSKGVEFSRAITKPLMMVSSLTVIPYIIAVRYSYPVIGIGLGTVFSFLLVIPIAYAYYHVTEYRKPRERKILDPVYRP